MSAKRVAIVGGGLAGLAAAAALAEHGAAAEIFEARRQLGGRAASFEDRETGERFDYCQHVSMGCCTQLEHFCQSLGVVGEFREDDTLHFVWEGGRRVDFRSTFGLPAPLHLAPGLLRLDFLSFTDRIMAARLLMRLALWERGAQSSEPTIADWLTEQGASPELTRRFFGTVLVSALCERLETDSVSAARQVFLTGFMRSSAAWKLRIPRRPLTEIFDEVAAKNLISRGVKIHRCASIKGLRYADGIVSGILDGEDRVLPFDAAIVAVPWRRLSSLLPGELRATWPESEMPARLAGSPITSAHLWFDRAVTELPHAVVIDRLSQWVFNGGATSDRRHYVQVVISASHALASRAKDDIINEIVADLRAVFPAAREAQRLESRLVTDPNAVFSVTPGCEVNRLPQRTPISGLFLAGDWTATGWPATMEGAIRSGYLAAGEVLRSFGVEGKPLVGELPAGPLAKLLLPVDESVSRMFGQAKT